MNELEKDQRIWGVMMNDNEDEIYEIQSTHIDSIVAKAKAFELKEKHPNKKVAVVIIEVMGII